MEATHGMTKSAILPHMNETMGSRLRRLRRERNLNQTEVYAETNVDRSHLSKLENDKAGVSWESIEALADFYDVSVDYLRGKSPVASIQSPENIAHSEDERLLLQIWRAMSESERAGLIALMGNRIKPNAL
ncbi:helix-turn-helix domain-containing protein [Acetobacter persici]|uniref:helix-turn-helix domain-containing protein n=1 Tax=Acetobacter persici TaxID=1076596 RepID=UPI001BA79BEF|nr:helix-turn-helix transcriptional regulator [Acetobacter persici]MBS1014464.1 helix-turn-helix transcriptional regulator [Acetobacter persici]